MVITVPAPFVVEGDEYDAVYWHKQAKFLDYLAVSDSDVAILTSDNPRSEDPLVILAAMSRGADEALVARPATELVVQPDRALAIADAVRRAVAGGAVIVAGKGHETGQEVDGELRPFDDRVVLAEALRARLAGAPAP